MNSNPRLVYKESANNVHVLRASYKKGNLSEMCSE